MELHVHDPNRPWARQAEALREQGLVVQENLACLRDEEAARLGVPSTKHDITVTHPARYDANHASLVSIETIRGYTDVELRLRMHEIWGRYCLLRWLWERHEKPIDTDLAHVPFDAQPRCDAVLDAKHVELHALFWKIHFEQRRRIARAGHRGDSDLLGNADHPGRANHRAEPHVRGAPTHRGEFDPLDGPIRHREDTADSSPAPRTQTGETDASVSAHRADSASARDAEFASMIPATANGKPVERATDAELLIAACEHAGMLAALRWAMDSRRRWDDPALMEVEDGPFLAEDEANA